MAASEETITLDLPVQHLDAPRFCEADPALLSLWAERLPRADMGETSQRLFEALQELNSCKLAPQLRFTLLDTLRPLVYSVCSSLGIHYHSQPIVLPPKAFQIYLRSQTMQMQLATGYQIVAHDTAEEKKGLLKKRTKQPELLAESLHRAITDLTSTLFRGHLIYSGTPPKVWQQLHRLHRLSLETGVSTVMFKDWETGQAHTISVEQCYIKALLLGSLRSNQLRQEDLTLVFHALGEWLGLVQLSDYQNPDEDNIVVDLDSDSPPMFAALFDQPATAANCRILLVEELLHKLSNDLVNKDRTTLSDDLIKHLLISWSSYTRRSSARIDTQDSLQLCVGMSSLHYFSAEQTDFEEFIRSDVHRALQNDSGSNRFMKHDVTTRSEDRDVWNTPYRADMTLVDLSVETIDADIRKFESSEHSKGNTRSYDNHPIEMTNVSAGGYALQWPADIAARLSNGDIVGIRESNSSNWSVGVVSWIRRSGKQKGEIGVKLLAPSVIPFAARVANRGADAANDDHADFRRVLLLPEIKLIGQAATLVTDNPVFREKQTLELLQQGHKLSVRLQKLVSVSGTVNQFEIEKLEKPWQQNGDSDQERERFEQLWSSL